MRNTTALALIAALAGAPVFAQETTVFTNADAAEDAVENLEEDIQEDFDKARNDRGFGRQGPMGWYGSVSFSATGTSGNSDTATVGIGSRFGHSDGTNGHDFVLSYKYSEADGTADADSLLAGYDYTRNFNPNFYGYGKLRLSHDKFSTFEEDYFAGAGIGYRVVNNDQVQWALEAGPGYRKAELSDGSDFSEAAASIGSKLTYDLGGDMFLTNDTTVLASSSDTYVVNDLGFNVALGDGPLALRTSLQTEYHSDPLPGKKSTDNAFGVSLVMNF